jgi:hypothetical protein
MLFSIVDREYPRRFARIAAKQGKASMDKN